MDAIFTDSHLDTRNKICILMSVTIPTLENARDVHEGNVKFVKQPGTYT